MISNNEQKNKFHQIIEQHKGVLFKIAKAYCRNDDERQDLLQEMMIQVWKSLPKYNDTFAITTWLYRICLNVSISFYRKSVTRQHINIPLVEELTSIREEESTEKQEQLSLLEKFISELNELDKALMFLYLEDKSHSEISEIMGLTVSNVGTKLGRIKEKHKKKFSQFNS
ncbi:MAG: sigma-70 family RNA polymerase sigma factor [Saprospiraceae bacterium]|nr:sigma-70 family RNA polymerase sigma factor [Saprospiraceae bacterium]